MYVYPNMNLVNRVFSKAAKFRIKCYKISPFELTDIFEKGFALCQYVILNLNPK